MKPNSLIPSRVRDAQGVRRCDALPLGAERELFPLAEMLAPGYLDLCAVIVERDANKSKGRRARGRYHKAGGERRNNAANSPHLQLAPCADRDGRRNGRVDTGRKS